MTFEDHEVAVHADIKDANQTIYFPEIKTTAKDGSDGDQDVSASKEDYRRYGHLSWSDAWI